MIVVNKKKAQSVNKNVNATIRHNKYKDFLLNKKYLTQSMNIGLKVKIIK